MQIVVVCMMMFLVLLLLELLDKFLLHTPLGLHLLLVVLVLLQALIGISLGLFMV